MGCLFYYRKSDGALRGNSGYSLPQIPYDVEETEYVERQIINPLTGESTTEITPVTRLVTYRRDYTEEEGIRADVLPNYGGSVEDYGAVRVTDDRAREIYAAASYEITFDGSGQPTGIIIYSKLTATADKTEIVADGVDGATITARVNDPQSTETISWIIDHDEEGAIPVQAVGGQSVLVYATTTLGKHVIEARSSTRYGSNAVEVTAQ